VRAVGSFFLAAVVCFSFSFTPPSAHAQVRVAATHRLVNGNTKKCMTLVRDEALSILDEVAWRGEVRPCDRASDPTGRQRFYFVSTSGDYFTSGTPSGTFTIRPASHPGEKCLHHVWGSDFRFDTCNGSVNQQFTFVARSGGYWIKSKVVDLVPCMSNLLGSDAVSGELCSSLSGSRIVWALEQADAPHHLVDSYGAGGDVYFLAWLASHGVDLASINQHTLAQLRSALAGAGHAPSSVLLYRGQVLNNITRAPFPGVRVCSFRKPAALGRLVGVTGVPHACAFTDAGGYYTLVGLPRDVEITNTSKREGYLQLALTTRTGSGDYEQEYNGTGTDALVEIAYSDERYAYSASFQHGTLGEMAFTVINETRAPSDPGYGRVTPGTYTANGAAGARFQIFTDPDGNGVFDTLYVDQVHTDPTASQTSGDGIPDGLFYTGSLGEGAGHALNLDLELAVDALVTLVPQLEPFLVDSEFPQAWRTETQFHGLAVVRDLPPGVYEAEISHPTRACYATQDAWTSGNAQRTRFEVIPNTMGDVRWYCLP
jgi:hypothetical protein